MEPWSSWTSVLQRRGGDTPTEKSPFKEKRRSLCSLREGGLRRNHTCWPPEFLHPADVGRHVCLSPASLWEFVMAMLANSYFVLVKGQTSSECSAVWRGPLKPPEPMALPLDVVSVKRVLGPQPSRPWMKPAERCRAAPVWPSTREGLMASPLCWKRMLWPHADGPEGVLFPSSCLRVASASATLMFGSWRSWAGREWVRWHGWGCYCWLRYRVGQLVCIRMYPPLKSVASLSCLFPALMSLPLSRSVFPTYGILPRSPSPCSVGNSSQRLFVTESFGHQRRLSWYLSALNFVWVHKKTWKSFGPLKELRVWTLT